MPNWGAGLAGAAGGAGAGAALGPWGALGGGAIGFLGGLFGGDAAEKNPYLQQRTNMTQSDYTRSINEAQINARQNQIGQQDFINQIRAQSLGQGAPSPAALMLQQAQQQQAQQAASTIASQRGLNPALAARMALDQQAMAGQAAAGQGAVLRAQEQQRAQQMLGGALGQQGQQALGLLGTASGAANGQNAINVQDNLGAGQINSSVAGGNADRANAATGGFLNGLGAAGAHLAPQLADGGGVWSGGNKNANFEGGFGFAHGGEVPQDSAQNDVVPSMLSPGEIVIPRSIAQGPDAAQRAADFVRAIQKHEAQARGPGPLGMASGGIVPDEEWTPPARNAWAPSFNGEAPVMLQPQAVSGFAADPFSRLPGTMGQPQALALPDPADPSLPADPAASPVGVPSNPFATLGVQPPPGWAPEAPPAPAAPQVPAPVSQKASAAQPKPATVAPTGSGLPRDFTKAQESEQMWMREAGAAQAQRAAQEAEQQAAHAAQLAEMQQASAATAQQRQAAADKLFSDYQSGTVDPNRYWSQMSTGGKISSAIGMLVGGIGAGLSHGPNLAVGVIDRAIDRDIEAQKLEMGKKQNALGFYMQQTGDIRLAQQLAKADARDVAAAQMSATALKFGGPQAQAALEAQIGAMRQKNAADRLAVEGQALDLTLKKQAVAQQKATEAALSGGITPASINLLPKDARERAVVHNGRVILAPSPEAAKEAKAALTQAEIMTKSVGRLRSLFQADPHGIVDRTKQAQADSVRSQLKLAGKELFKLGVLSESDSAILDSMVPDVGSLTAFDGAKAAKLTELDSLIRDRISANLNAIGGGR